MWVTMRAVGLDWMQSTMRLGVLCVSALLCVSVGAQVGMKPLSTPLPPPVPEPRDQPFRGSIQLHVQATDTIHRLFHVTETIPVQTRGEMVLLYPELGDDQSWAHSIGYRAGGFAYADRWKQHRVAARHDRRSRLSLDCAGRSALAGTAFRLPAATLLGEVAPRDG